MRWKFWKKKIPTINLTMETRTVEAEVRSFKVAPYVEPTDKEMIDGLNEGGNYEAACRIEELKKKNANLKRKLTILKKKYETE